MVIKRKVSEMTYSLEAKVAVITGGNKGIGKAIAILFAKSGAKVVVAGRSMKDCKKVTEEIKSFGGEAFPAATDVTSVESIRHLMDVTINEYGDIDIMVNCAGMAITKPILEVDEKDYGKVMDTNLKGVFFGSKEAAAKMIEMGHGGRIIQIASIGGLKGTNQISTYCASKAAVLNLTKTMAIEWSRYGICTTAICPGYVKTEINAEIFDDPDKLERALKGIPQRRLGTVEEVAAIALFLASDESGMISGSAIIADMGATAL